MLYGAGDGAATLPKPGYSAAVPGQETTGVTIQDFESRGRRFDRYHKEETGVSKKHPSPYDTVTDELIKGTKSYVKSGPALI